MHRLVKIALTAAGGALLFGAAVVPSWADTAAENVTGADITCNAITPYQYPYVTVRAWGDFYPATTDLVVDETITLKQQPWKTSRITLTSTVAGTWSTSTDTYQTSDPGLYELDVTVSTAEGKLLGTATDSCTL
jgi:hypothetical protein